MTYSERRLFIQILKTFFPYGPNMLQCVINSCHFQDFEGEAGDAKAGRDYFRKRFSRLAQKAGRSKEREIYIQYVRLRARLPFLSYCFTASVTTATDTAMLRVVMAAVEGTYSSPRHVAAR
jgi:hypothetical protein